MIMLLTESWFSSMPVGVLGWLRLAGFVESTDAELVLVTFLQLRYCALAHIALDFNRLDKQINMYSQTFT